MKHIRKILSAILVLTLVLTSNIVPTMAYASGGSATQGSADVEPGLIGDPDGNGPDPDYWEQDENGEWVLKEDVNIEEDVTPVETPAVTETPVAIDEQRFADVAPDAWYYDAVNTMAINGILNGYPDGQFHPDNYVTEAELLTIIYRLATTDEPWSKDDCGHWAGRIINTLHWTRVRTTYTFCNNLNADEYANRGEATTAIIALLTDAGRIKYDKATNRWTSNYYTKVHDWTYPYNDDVAGYISDWEAIKFGRPEGMSSLTNHRWLPARVVMMYEFGFVHGKDTAGTFDPAGYLTRAELCQMLANAGITECLNITLDIDDWGYGG